MYEEEEKEEIIFAFFKSVTEISEDKKREKIT
jgi:hypothetical protein